MKKIALVFVVILCVMLIFTACFKEESCTFPEGTYCYTDTPFLSMDDLTIEGLSFTFTNANQNNNCEINTVKSRLDEQIFTVEFLIKFVGEQDAKQFDVEFLSKMSDIVDMYPVRLWLKDEEKNLDYVFILRLWLSNDFSDTNGSTSANSIYIDCIGQEIGHIEDIKELIIYNDIGDIKNGNGVIKNVKLFDNDIELHLEK